MTALDDAYRRAGAGDAEAFTEWTGGVEMRLRAALRSFARRVDVEGIVQEGLLRMWVLAPTIDLEGENASLRYALRIVRNLALREAERESVLDPLDEEEIERTEKGTAAPDPSSDPALREAILDCLDRLPGKPRRALAARLGCQGAEPDRALAEKLRMSLNTFLQNIVRARRHLAACLESRGVSLGTLRP